MNRLLARHTVSLETEKWTVLWQREHCRLAIPFLRLFEALDAEEMKLDPIQVQAM